MESQMASHQMFVIIIINKTGVSNQNNAYMKIKTTQYTTILLSNMGQHIRMSFLGCFPVQPLSFGVEGRASR
jgi:hypothetical protein